MDVSSVQIPYQDGNIKHQDPTPPRSPILPWVLMCYTIMFIWDLDSLFPIVLGIVFVGGGENREEVVVGTCRQHDDCRAFVWQTGRGEQTQAAFCDGDGGSDFEQ